MRIDITVVLFHPPRPLIDKEFSYLKDGLVTTSGRRGIIVVMASVCDAKGLWFESMHLARYKCHFGVEGIRKPLLKAHVH